jgi:hypothetical protein
VTQGPFVQSFNPSLASTECSSMEYPPTEVIYPIENFPPTPSLTHSPSSTRTPSLAHSPSLTESSSGDGTVQMSSVGSAFAYQFPAQVQPSYKSSFGFVEAKLPTFGKGGYSARDRLELIRGVRCWTLCKASSFPN